MTYQEELSIKLTDQLIKLEQQLPAYCTTFFTSISQSKAIKTQVAYAHDLKVFFDYMSKIKDVNTIDGLNKITSDDIEHFLKDSSTCNKTKARKLAAIKTFFKKMYTKHLIDDDPASQVEKPKLTEKPIVYLNDTEAKNLIRVISDDKKSRLRLRDLAIVSMFMEHGIRVGELIGLNVSDIDFNMGTFTITRKNGNRVTLYLNDKVKKTIMKYLSERNRKYANEDALFISREGNRVKTEAVENMVKKYAKQVTDKPITCHKLRATFATQFYSKNPDIVLLAKLMGHKNINITKDRYAAVVDKKMRDAAKINII